MEGRKENLQMNLNVYSFSFFLNLLSQILLSSMIFPKLVPFRLILLKNMNFLKLHSLMKFVKF